MTIAGPVDEDFAELIAPYRREIFAHCYRMMGSLHEAEDQVQETMLRAWRGYDRFSGRSSVRTWIHRIATNTCLTALEKSRMRPLPTGLGAPSSGPEDLVQAELPWLEPAPDAMLDVADPSLQVERRESVRLAFIAALQHLPPRQRAVLILRDVLVWRAAEVAEATGTSEAGVNSLLQRARAKLAAVAPIPEASAEPGSAREQEVLRRFVAGFEEYDIAALVDLFTDRAIWEMPPFEGWYEGPATIGELIARQCPATAPGEMLLLPARANGQPAFGLYLRAEDGVHRPFHLQVLELDGDRVAHVVAFFDTALFAAFGLPAALDRRTGA